MLFAILLGMALSESTYQKIFVDYKKLLSSHEFERSVREANETGRPLKQVLVERIYISPVQFLQILSDYFKVPEVSLKVGSIKDDVLKLIPEAFASTNLTIAFEKTNDVIKVACEDPSDSRIREELQHILQSRIEFYVASEYELRRALLLYSGDLLQGVRTVVAELESNADAQERLDSTVKLMEAVLEAAVLMDTSDIHIEPYESEVMIRFRIDGLLRTATTVPKRMSQAINARLKVVSELKVDQNRLPQDGRFTQIIKGQEVNFRISTVPSFWGEKVVMRVLPKEAHLFDLHNLGLLDKDLFTIKSNLKRPHGMILVTGPTGSGKTTTLYACLQQIGNDRIEFVNISTIEDPVEYTMPRITQIQTKSDINLNFASGLRALLRQDPDIIMVGEIRDKETADSAVRAALVGRLVLSSLHTNNAAASIPRLIDMGVEPYLISSTTCLIIAQRLTRRLCRFCRFAYQPNVAILQELMKNHDLGSSLERLKRLDMLHGYNITNLRFYQSKGCIHCNGTGYQGRSGIYEILQVSSRIQEAINSREDSNKIQEIAFEEGMKSLFDDGLIKVIAGEIDLPELLRAAYS